MSTPPAIEKINLIQVISRNREQSVDKGIATQMCG